MSGVSQCPHCGANLSFEQMKGQQCPFCHTVFKHHQQAVEHAALVNQMLAQQMQASNPWMAGPGGPGVPQISPQYGAPAPQMNHAAYTQAAINHSVKKSAPFMLIGVGCALVAVLASVGVAVGFMLL